MRVVLLISKLHAGAELALNKILPDKDINVIGIVKSDISFTTKRYWNYIKLGVSRLGLINAAMVGMFSYLHILYVYAIRLLLLRRSKWLTLDELSEKYSVDTYLTTNINSKAARAKIEQWQPDVIVSLYFDQILKKKVINISKVATLNMHPGLLPRYRGLWPEFWKLLNEEEYSGVSVHHLIEKVDAGDVVAQETFLINKEDTKFSLALKSAQRGTALMISVLKRLKMGKKLEPLSLIGKPKYYSFPDRQSFDKFHAMGKRLFSPIKLWKLMRSLV